MDRANRPPSPPPAPPFEQLAPGVKTGMDFRGQGPVVRKAVNAFHWINLYPLDRAIHLLGPVVRMPVSANPGVKF